MPWLAALQSLLIATLLCAACQSSASDAAQQKQPKSYTPVGKLIGHVRLAAGASLPQYADIDLVRRPLRSHDLPAPPAECADAQRAARTAVEQDPDHGLRGVAVAASDFVRMPSAEPATHHAAIEHCRLTPALVAATSGDLLVLENRDAYDFEPLIGPTYGAERLAHGEKREIPLGAPSIDVLQCSLGAPCGRSDLLVFAHPVHTVSAASGQFSIDNFPAHELVRVTAWHPLFEPAETFVWLEPGQTSSIAFDLTPKKRFSGAAP